MGKKIIKLYLLSALLGMLTGVVGSVFQLAIARLDAAMSNFFILLSERHWPVGIVSGVFSMVFVFIAWLSVQYIAPEAAGSGVQEMEGAMLHLKKVHWRRLLPVKFFSGILALSAKMVLGREGPTIQMGGNLGEMIGDFFKLTRMRHDVMIAAGSAAGLATAFNAPLAGVLFVMEEMRNQFNYSFTNFKIVFIACVMATIVLHKIVGSQPAIPMAVFDLPSIESLWLFLLFGVAVGFVGLIFNKSLIGILNYFDSKPLYYRISYVLGIGFIIGCLAYWYAPSVGGGYLIISQSLIMAPGFKLLCILILLRFSTSLLSYSSGVPGGIFAPMLALGTLLGLAAFQIIQYLHWDANVQAGMFAVAGMGALFAAIVRSPITGVVLVVEMTQNYSLILPLMVTCLTATTVVQLARNKPIYTQLLYRGILKMKKE